MVTLITHRLTLAAITGSNADSTRRRPMDTMMRLVAEMDIINVDIARIDIRDSRITRKDRGGGGRSITIKMADSRGGTRAITDRGTESRAVTITMVVMRSRTTAMRRATISGATTTADIPRALETI